MKVKNANLKWNVLMCDFNSGKIRNYNIFGQSFVDELHKKVLKKDVNCYDELREFIKRWAMYHYWCKSEFEIAVGGLFSKHPEEFEKIDIYRQIEMNLDRITEYVNKELRLSFI